MTTNTTTKKTRQAKFYATLPTPPWATESTPPSTLKAALRRAARFCLRRIAEGRGMIQWGEGGALPRLFWRKHDHQPLRLIDGVAGPKAPLP